MSKQALLWLPWYFANDARLGYRTQVTNDALAELQQAFKNGEISMQDLQAAGLNAIADQDGNLNFFDPNKSNWNDDPNQDGFSPWYNSGTPSSGSGSSGSGSSGGSAGGGGSGTGGGSTAELGGNQQNTGNTGSTGSSTTWMTGGNVGQPQNLTPAPAPIIQDSQAMINQAMQQTGGQSTNQAPSEVIKRARRGILANIKAGNLDTNAMVYKPTLLS